MVKGRLKRLGRSVGAVAREARDAGRAKLVAEGYDVRSIQREDGLIAVRATKDGQRLELFRDAALNIVRTKVGD